jgi:PAS domain S-box-containing protein
MTTSASLYPQADLLANTEFAPRPFAEVSCRMLNCILHETRMKGVPIEQLLEGTGLSPSEVEDVENSIWWSSYCVLMVNARRAIGFPGLERAGRGLLYLPGARPFAALARLFFSPMEFYIWNSPPGRHMLMSCLLISLNEISADEIEIEIKMEDGYPSCPEYWAVAKGVLGEQTAVLGYPPALVEVSETEDRAVYRIQIPRKRTRLATIRRWCSLALSEWRGELRDGNDIMNRFQRSQVVRLTELEAERKARRESEQSFAHLFRSAPALTVICTMDGKRIVDINERAIEIMGWDRDDVLGRSTEELRLWDETRSESRGYLMRTLAQNGSIRDFETRLRTRTGESVPVLISAVTATIGGELCAIFQAMSIGDLKQTELELERYRDDLKVLVDERARELEQSQVKLDQSKHLAGLGTLAAGIAHQLNNPLGSILASAQLALIAKDDASEPEQKLEMYENVLADVVEQATRGGKIVRSVLQFSRGETTLKSREDLRAVVDRAHRLTQSYAQDLGARIEFRSTKQSCPVVMSVIEIEQALVNILRNAVESHDENAVVVLEIFVREKTAEVVVRDNGHGIEDADLEQIRNPFYTTRLTKGGTGLGLSVAHGIITDHRGTLEILSQVGEGTRVTIRLPIAF